MQNQKLRSESLIEEVKAPEASSRSIPLSHQVSNQYPASQNNPISNQYIAPSNNHHVRFNYLSNAPHQSAYPNPNELPGTLVSSVPVYDHNQNASQFPQHTNAQTHETWNLNNYGNNNNNNSVEIVETANWESSANQNRQTSAVTPVVLERQTSEQSKGSSGGSSCMKMLPWILCGLMALAALIFLTLLLINLFENSKNNKAAQDQQSTQQIIDNQNRQPSVDNRPIFITDSIPVYYYPRQQINCLDPQFSQTEMCRDATASLPPPQDSGAQPMYTYPQPAALFTRPPNNQLSELTAPRIGSHPSVYFLNSRQFRQPPQVNRVTQNQVEKPPAQADAVVSRDSIQPFEIDPLTFEPIRRRESDSLSTQRHSFQLRKYRH